MVGGACWYGGASNIIVPILFVGGAASGWLIALTQALGCSHA
jgi:hypothetical protein